MYPHIFNEDNVALIATHTHSTPGGYNGYTLYNIPNLGFNEIVFAILHKGILQVFVFFTTRNLIINYNIFKIKAIQVAHDRLRKGHLYVNSGKLFNVNINRSPVAYFLNPKNERNL